MTILQKSPYLDTQITFEEDVEVTLDKAYVDIANRVNERTIGLHAINTQVITGNKYFLSNQTQSVQSLRQIYLFTAAGSYNHGIDTTQIIDFVTISGTLYDGTNWYPLPVVSTSGFTNQVSLRVTPTQIIITTGGGSPPPISRVRVYLEWITNS